MGSPAWKLQSLLAPGDHWMVKLFSPGSKMTMLLTRATCGKSNFKWFRLFRHPKKSDLRWFMRCIADYIQFGSENGINGGSSTNILAILIWSQRTCGCPAYKPQRNVGLSQPGWAPLNVTKNRRPPIGSQLGRPMFGPSLFVFIRHPLAGYGKASSLFARKKGDSSEAITLMLMGIRIGSWSWFKIGKWHSPWSMHHFCHTKRNGSEVGSASSIRKNLYPTLPLFETAKKIATRFTISGFPAKRQRWMKKTASSAWICIRISQLTMRNWVWSCSLSPSFTGFPLSSAKKNINGKSIKKMIFHGFSLHAFDWNLHFFCSSSPYRHCIP